MSAGNGGLIPHLVVKGGAAAVDYYKAALGAEELSRVPGPDGRLMHAALKRFLAVAGVAIAVLFVCGAAMIGIAWSAAARAGLAFNMPLDWYTMIATFFVMLALFIHVRSVLFRRLDVAVTAAKWPDGAAALAAIRWEVSINLVLGTFVIFFVRLGGTA